MAETFERPVDQSREEALVEGVFAVGKSWSPDGKLLVFDGRKTTSSDVDIWLWQPGEEPTAFLATEAMELAPAVSPDGRWLAYVSDHDGERRAYAQPLADGGRVFSVSSGRGTEPRWARDGTELFYRDGSRMMVVEVVDTGDWALGVPGLLLTPSMRTTLLTADFRTTTSPAGVASS